MGQQGKLALWFFCVWFNILSACDPQVSPAMALPERESQIPAKAVKVAPENDETPPQLLSDEYENPVPLPYPVNTRGVEDSAFILPDGQTLYVWFTPDHGMDAAAMSQDNVTGIYKFKRQADGWSKPERVWLVEPGEQHLDGCGFFQGNQAWVCAVRPGLEGIHWLTAAYENGRWSKAELAEFNPEHEVGELHLSADGSELYFHSSRPGGKGGLDIWLSRKENGAWGEPVNLANVNSERDEGWPALNPAEDELWITKDYGLWRSKKVSGIWQTPELIISSLAGEATIDREGNVYFTHHYFSDNQMIEADIYVAKKK